MSRFRAVSKVICVTAAGLTSGLATCLAGSLSSGCKTVSANPRTQTQTQVQAQAPQSASPQFRFDGVAPWRGDATAAYSIIHDDVCDKGAIGVFTAADPELTARGLHAGFGVIASACDSPQGGTWNQVKALVAHGHDVFNHSWDHPCMTNDKALGESCDPVAPHSVDFAKEIGQSTTALQARAGVTPTFFIFPYDVCDPTAVAYLKANGYLWARCGGPGVNKTELRGPFAIDFDVFGPSYSKYFATDACTKTAAGKAPLQYTTTPADYTDACRLYVLDHYVDEAIAAHGWGVREFHGLAPMDKGGWETVPVTDYRAHLDRLVAKSKAGELWVEGPTPILEYQRARDPKTCATPVIAGATLHFETLPTCPKNAPILSYRIATTDGSDPMHLHVKQGDIEMPAKRVSAGHFVVDASPARGDAVLVP